MLILERASGGAEIFHEGEQAGNRRGVGADNHLLLVSQLRRACEHFERPLWKASLGVSKAFDSVDHEAIWAAMTAAGIPEAYISVTRNLYFDLRVRVRLGGCRSAEIPLKRGARQGGPLSPILFNLATQFVFSQLKPQWAVDEIGFLLGGGGPLPDARYSDDLLLASASEPGLRRVISAVRRLFSEVGLEFHLGVCPATAPKAESKSLTNAPGWEQGLPAWQVDDDCWLPVLARGKFAERLGASIGFGDREMAAVKHRINKSLGPLGGPSPQAP